MKKLFSIILVLITSITLSLSSVACNFGNSGDDSSTSSTSSSSSSSSSTTDDTDKSREVNYVHVDFGTSIINEGDSEVAVDADFYVAFDETTDDVDFVLKCSSSYKEPDNEYITSVNEAEYYYVDGIEVDRYRYGQYDTDKQKIVYGNYEDHKEIVGELDEVLDSLKDQLKSPDSEVPEEAIEFLSGVIDGIENIIASRGDIAYLELESFDYSLNFKTEVIDKVSAWLTENKDKKLINAIASLTGDTDAATLKAKIAKIFEPKINGDITVADVIDRVIAFANTYDGVSINLKALCDSFQEEAAIETSEVIDLIKAVLASMIGGNGESQYPENYNNQTATPSTRYSILPPVTEGQTVYDYFHALADTVNVNDLLAMISQPGEDESQSLTLTWEGIGTTLVSTMESLSIADILGNNYDTIVGYLENVVSKAVLSAKMVVDDYSYPVKIELKSDVKLNIPGEAWMSSDEELSQSIEVGQQISIDVAFEYAEKVPADATSVFIIPSDLNIGAQLNFNDNKFTLEQARVARTEGLIIDIIPASGIYASGTTSMKVECYRNGDIPLPDAETVEYVKIENGKVVISANFFTALDSDETFNEYILVFSFSVNHETCLSYYNFKKLSAYSKV